jgi:iron complex outermembrane recepter protein
MPTSSFVSRAYKKTRLRHALLAITLTLASATFPALASTKLRLDIPAQDLGSALKELSADANEQVLFSQAVVAGRRSNKLRGDYTTDTALAILLDGTDLRVERTQSGVLLILPPDAEAAHSRQPVAPAEAAPPEPPAPLIRLAQSIDAPVSDASAPGKPEVSTAAAAESGNSLDEVVVTARYKSESLQRAPLSVTALSGADIENRGYSNISQVAASAPNVNLEPAPGGFGKSVFASIRGVGQNDFKFTLEPGVGFYVDDVYFATVFGSIFTLGDINRVEILRGPQGTLFGKNTEGGAIRIFNEKPQDDDAGYAEVGYGSYNRESVRAAMNFTLIPGQLFARVSGGSLRSDGYQTIVDFACANPGLAGNIKATTYGDCNVGKLGGDDVYDYRAALRWLPTDKLEINVSGDLTDDKGPGPADTIVAINPNATFLKSYNPSVAIPTFGIPYDTRFLPPNPYTTYVTFKDPVDGINIPSDNTLYSWGFNGTVDWDNPWGFHVKSITGLRGEHGEFSQSYGGAPIPVTDLWTTLQHHQFSEELQLSGVSFDNALDWTVGGYYFNGTNHQGGIGDLIVISLVQVPDDPSTDKNKSVFAHTEYHFTDKFSTEVGLRYSDEDKTYEYYRLLLRQYQTIPAGDFLFPITAKSLSYSRVDPKVGFQYQWTPDLMSYIQWSTGYKAGGFNTRPVSAAQATTFKPETLTAYEIGLKSEWLEHRLRANTALFYSQYKDLQLQANGVDSNGDLAVLTENVGRANIKGAELEIQAEPVRGLTGDFSIGYLDYKNTDLGSAAGVSGGPTLSSMPPLTPKWKGSLGIQYAIPEGQYGVFMPRLDYTYQSLVYNDAPNTAIGSQAAYGVLNGRLIWTSMKGTWTATFAVNNVTDKFYYIDKYANYSTYGTVEGQPSMPRTFDFTLKRTF